MANASKIQGYDLKDASARENITLLDGRLDTAELNIQTLQNAVQLSKSAVNSFNGGIDSYFKKVKSNIQAVQAGSGTPSPTNVRAISGFTECNVTDKQVNQWDEETESGAINAVTGVKITSSGQLRAKNYIKIRPNVYYYTKSPQQIWCIFYDENYNIVTSDLPTGVSSSSYARQLQNMSWKAPATAKYMLFYLVSAYGTTYNYDVSVNNPATDTDYHAYNATTATISFGSAGTVYGGEVDLISGKLVVDKVGEVIKGSDDVWDSFAVGTNTATARWQLSYPAKRGETSSSKVGAISSTGLEAPRYWYSSRPNELPTEGNMCFAMDTNYARFYMTDTTIADITAFKNAFVETTLVYPLATPIEYQLTPAQLRSLVGTNNLTSSTGDTVDVEYITNETIAWILDLVIQVDDVDENLDVNDNRHVDDIVEVEIKEKIVEDDSQEVR